MNTRIEPSETHSKLSRLVGELFAARRDKPPIPAKPTRALEHAWSKWVVWMLTGSEHGVLQHAAGRVDIEDVVKRVASIYASGLASGSRAEREAAVSGVESAATLVEEAAATRVRRASPMERASAMSAWRAAVASWAAVEAIMDPKVVSPMAQMARAAAPHGPTWVLAARNELTSLLEVDPTLADAPAHMTEDGAVQHSKTTRDKLRKAIVDMRDRQGNILAANPQLPEVIEKIARAIEET